MTTLPLNHVSWSWSRNSEPRPLPRDQDQDLYELGSNVLETRDLGLDITRLHESAGNLRLFVVRDAITEAQRAVA